MFHMIVFIPPEKCFGNSLEFINYRRHIFCTRIGRGVICTAIIIFKTKEKFGYINIKLLRSKYLTLWDTIPNFMFIAILIINPITLRPVS